MAGTHTLIYTVTDDAGNEAEAVIRTVLVLGIIDPNVRDTDGGTDGADGSGNTDPVADTDGMAFQIQWRLKQDVTSTQ